MAVSATVGGLVVAAVVAWGIFSVARTAVARDTDEARLARETELADHQRLILQGQREVTAVLAEMRGSVDRIEAMLKEVG